jgi:hypothetical protein
LWHQEGDSPILIRNYVKVDENGWVKSVDEGTISGNNLNARGVCRL